MAFEEKRKILRTIRGIIANQTAFYRFMVYKKCQCFKRSFELRGDYIFQNY